MILLALSFITNLSPTITDTYLVIVFLISASYFHFKRLKYDLGIFLIIIFFLLINFVCALFYGTFEISTLIGMILRMLIPYYILKILDKDFLFYFEKIIYFFAILSIPFYILQLIVPGIYLQLNSLFRPLMTDLRYQDKIFNYVFHTVHYNAIFRNSGFAWEPGGFGYVIGIAIMFNVVRNSFRITRTAVLLILVGLTTLSTTFYLFILIFLGFYLYEKKQNIAILYFALPVMVLVSIYAYQLPFIGEKINLSIQRENINASNHYLESRPLAGAGRFGGLIFEYNRIVNYPFGYGINTGAKGKNISGDLIAGPNGLAHFTRMWGVFGFIFLLYALYALSKRLSIIYFCKNKLFPITTILLFFFSNPIEREPILLMLGYYSIFVLTKKEVYTHIYKNVLPTQQYSIVNQ